MKKYIICLVSICLLSNQYVSGQASQSGQKKDSLPPVTMSSDKLITLDYYNPNTAYGTAYSDLMIKPEKRNIFDRQGAKFILPALFIGYGVSARFNSLPIRRFDYDIDHEIRKIKPFGSKNITIDSYLEFSTPVLAFGLDFLPGIESQHNLRDRALVMATSYLLMEAMVYGLKENVHVLRPRYDRYNSPPHELNADEKEYFSKSFPSGHMAVAMTGAHILYKEYKDVSPWIGVGGYAAAVATGTLRMFNYAHWLSDVVMSAGIGLLSVELGYMLLPVWHRLFGLSNGGDNIFAAVPAIGYGSAGLGIVCRF